MIYLDHNATTRPDPAVVAEMLPCLQESFGNPSSLHAFGQAARRLADLARQRVATLIGAAAEDVVFTSGGSEANNQVLRGVARPGRHLVVSGIEHQAVLEPCRQLEAAGVRITRVPAGNDGVVRPEALAAAFTPETDLVSLMLVNNDTGVIQPVAEIAALARARGILVHTDAVQAAGKIAISVPALAVDFLTLSAHKLHGPKGVGALYLRPGRELPALIAGGTQENRRRAGTENLPGIVGFGKACELAARPEIQIRIAQRRDRLETGIRNRFPAAIINGAEAPRVANTLLVSFPGIPAQTLAMNLDLAGIAVSTGSACSSAHRAPSTVLLAMGRTPEQAQEAIRFSLGPDNTEAEIDHVLAVLKQLVR